MSAAKQWLYEVDGMHLYKGVLCMPDTTPDILQWIENDLQFEAGDVLICGYPCSGEIYDDILILCVYNDSDDDDNNDDYDDSAVRSYWEGGGSCRYIQCNSTSDVTVDK